MSSIKSFIVAAMLLAAIGGVYAASNLQLYPVVVAPGVANTSYSYDFVFCSDALCSSVILNVSQRNLTTNTLGFANDTLNVSTMSTVPSYLYTYRNGTLVNRLAQNRNAFEENDTYVISINSTNGTGAHNISITLSNGVMLNTTFSDSDTDTDTDTNFYVTSVGVTGTTTKTVQVNLSNGVVLNATFTDIDTTLSESQVEAMIFDSDNTGNTVTTGNVTANKFFGTIDCTNITGGSDSNFCVDADSGGSGSNNYTTNFTINSTNSSGVSMSFQWNVERNGYTDNLTAYLNLLAATTTQDGFMTASQVTALGLKALGGTCTGSNSTHINVTMNATSAGAQCFPVVYVDDDNPDSDAEVPDVISVIGGIIGANSVSGLLTTIAALTIGDGGDRIDVYSTYWNISNNQFNITIPMRFTPSSGNSREFSNGCNETVNSSGVYFTC